MSIASKRGVLAISMTFAAGGAAGAGGVAAAESPAAAADEPISVMSISTFESPNYSTPAVETAMRARAASLNAAGGINGHPLEITFCNDRLDPNEAGACARRAVEDEVVAVIGGSTPNAATILPVLADAGIAWFGSSGTSGDIEIQDPIAYPLQAGVAGMLIAAGRVLVDEGGATNVTVIAEDIATAVQGGERQVLGVEAAGATATLVTVPAGAPDYSASAATALDNDPDGVAIAGVPADIPKIILALRQAGYDGPIATVSSGLPPASIEALGDDADNVYLTYRLVPTTNTDNPCIAQYIDELHGENPDEVVEENGLNSWTSLLVFEELAAGIDGPISAESFRTAADAVDAPIVTGCGPDYAGVPDTPDVADYPRVSQFVAIASRIEGGVVHQIGDFFNPLAATESTATTGAPG